MGTRCVGYLYTVSEWFNPLEHPSNHFSAEKARCVEVFNEFGVVRLYRTLSNLIFTVGTSSLGYLYTVSEWFNPLEPPRTFLNHLALAQSCLALSKHPASPYQNTVPCNPAYLGGADNSHSTHLQMFSIFGIPYYGNYGNPRLYT